MGRFLDFMSNKKKKVTKLDFEEFVPQKSEKKDDKHFYDKVKLAF